MTGSILEDVKTFCGITTDIYDQEIISEINSSFFILYDNGLGPATLFHIVDSSAQWKDFIADEYIYPTKDFVSNKVRLYFDPPRNEFLANLRVNKLEELLFRLRTSKDRINKEVP